MHISQTRKVSCMHFSVYIKYVHLSFFAAGSKPFFYGTNNLACIYLTHIGLHRKKRSLQLPVHNFVHSFIYYDGWFAEFGTKDTTLRRHSPKYAQCGPKIMHPPAGFSKLPFDCIRRCASKYHLVFGKYNLLNNNCHFFSNRMMEVLCHEVTCPLWCLWLMNLFAMFRFRRSKLTFTKEIVSSVQLYTLYVYLIDLEFMIYIYFLMVLYMNRVTCICKTLLFCINMKTYGPFISITIRISEGGCDPPHSNFSSHYLACTPNIVIKKVKV